MHDPAHGSGEKSWRARKPPGDGPHMYAVYVDDKDKVWCTDWSSNTMLRFDPAGERFDAITLPLPQSGKFSDDQGCPKVALSTSR